MRASQVLALVILVLPLLAGPGFAAPAGDAQPEPPARIGSSEKICQLTGEIDWATGQPTAARTFSRFGVEAADLGYPVEHEGRLILLFGDSWPPHGAGSDRDIPPDDAVGIVTRVAPPQRDGLCLDLRIHTEASTGRFAPATIVGPPRIAQGFFNVPSGGISVGGLLYGFFWTGHCAAPAPLSPAPGAPLAWPTPSAACPENAVRNSIGRGVLARSDDEGRHFTLPAPLPEGFVYTIAVDATAVDAMGRSAVPPAQRQGILVFAVPRYRASLPFLAIAPEASFADPTTWRYFAGREATILQAPAP